MGVALRVAVGVHTSRDGHYVVCLRHDSYPAASELPFARSAKSYASPRQPLKLIVLRLCAAQFIIRLDGAEQCGASWCHFGHGLNRKTHAA
jgi:hypothetical protein